MKSIFLHFHIYLRTGLAVLILGVGTPVSAQFLSFFSPTETDSSRLRHKIKHGEQIYHVYPDSALQISKQVTGRIEQLLSGTLTQAEKKACLKTQAAAFHLMGTALLQKHDSRSVRYYFEKSLTISKQLHDQQGIAKAWFSLGKVQAQQGKPEAALTCYQRSLQLYRQIGHQKGEAECLHMLGNYFFRAGEVDKGLRYNLQSLKIREQIGDKKGQSESLNNLGTIYQRSDPDKGIACHQRSLKLRLQLNDVSGMAESYLNLAYLYQKQGAFSKALADLNKSLVLWEKAGNLAGLTETINQLGHLYLQQQDAEKATSYYQQSLKLSQGLGNVTGIGYSYNYLAQAAHLNGNSEKEIDYHKKAIDIFRQLHYHYGIAAGLSGLGSVYLNLGKLELAASSFEQSKSLFGQAEDNMGLAGAELGLARINAQRGNNRLALKGASAVLQSARAFGNASLISESEFLVSELYRKMGNYQAALEHHDQYILYRDGLVNEQNKRSLVQQQLTYEYTKKEAALKAAFQKQDAVQQARLEGQKILRNGLIAVLLLTLAFGLFFIKVMRQRHKSMALLALKSVQLQRQKVREIQQRQELASVRAMFQGQENERTRIAQELHDRLGSMLATIKLYFHINDKQFDLLTEMQRKRYQQATELLDEAFHEVRRIAHDMVSVVLMKFGLLAAIKELALNINRSGQLYVSVLSRNLEERLDTEVEIVIYRIVQELTSNALRHAQASEISIHLSSQDEKLVLVVEDNGCGFDPTRTPTGIGLNNIKSRVNYLHGTFYYTTSPETGTRFTITIPLKEVIAPEVVLQITEQDTAQLVTA